MALPKLQKGTIVFSSPYREEEGKGWWVTIYCSPYSSTIKPSLRLFLSKDEKKAKDRCVQIKKQLHFTSKAILTYAFIIEEFEGTSVLWAISSHCTGISPEAANWFVVADLLTPASTPLTFHQLSKKYESRPSKQ